ncbi:MAG: hypothetical protein H0T62_11485 [Parachlamydiaceae bacterium]|nr:hypothetical protein [Parachlamydiaceae bacterium]
MESVYSSSSANIDLARSHEQQSNSSSAGQFYLFLEIIWNEIKQFFSSLVISFSCCFQAKKVEDTPDIEPVFVDQVLKASGYTFDKVKLQMDDSPIPDELQERIAAIQQKIDERKIPLTAWAPRPKQSYPIDQKNAERYLSCLPDGYQKTGRIAIENTRHITMVEFNQALETCVLKLNHEMVEKKVLTYTVGIVYGKSNQWVTSLALLTLEQLPTSHFTLGSKQGTMDLIIPEQEFDMSHVQEKTVVLFDDVSYSGKQMGKNIAEVAQEMTKVPSLDQKNNNLFVVIPFITKSAFKFFNEINKRNENKLTITLITMEERIQSTTDIFKQSQFWFEALCPGKGNEKGDTSCYTDWRLPDATSFWGGWGHKTNIHKITKELSNGEEEIVSEAFWCDGNNWKNIGKPVQTMNFPWETIEVKSDENLQRPEENFRLHPQHLYQFIPQDIPRPYALLYPSI